MRSRPRRGERHTASPASRASPLTAAATATTASWRRTAPFEARQRAIATATQDNWQSAYAGWASTLQTRSATARPGTAKGWAASIPAAAYSTGHMADSAAQSAPADSTAYPKRRQRADRKRPSGKQSIAQVTKAMTSASGHTPSQAHQIAAGSASPIWRPRKSTAWASPAAPNSRPSRCQGRASSVHTPPAPKASASSPLCAFARRGPRAKPVATSATQAPSSSIATTVSKPRRDSPSTGSMVAEGAPDGIQGNP